MGIIEDFRNINLQLAIEGGAMGRVKEMLLEKPFKPEQGESLFNLARRMLREIDKDLSYETLPQDYERDLVRLKATLEEIVEHENLDPKV